MLILTNNFSRPITNKENNLKKYGFVRETFFNDKKKILFRVKYNIKQYTCCSGRVLTTNETVYNDILSIWDSCMDSNWNLVVKMTDHRFV